MKNNYVTLRGHHLGLLHDYFIVGLSEETIVKATDDYGAAFNENKIDIVRRLKKKTKIMVTDKIDDLCKKCPKKRRKICSKDEKYHASVAKEDRADLRIYGLEVGKEYSLDYLLKKIKQKPIEW